MKHRARRNRFEGMDPQWAMKAFLCYIEWCIGTISDGDAFQMEQATPLLQAQFGCSSGTWYEVIEEGYALPVSGRKILLDAWRDMNGNVSPQDFVCEFATMFVEKMDRRSRNPGPRVRPRRRFNH